MPIKMPEKGPQPNGLAALAVPRARIAFREDDTPFSEDFGDIYCSPSGGLEEKDAVFVRGNGLPERWSGRSIFTIGEFGFGLGIAFLATLAAKQRARWTGVLHYASFESTPARPEDFTRALALFPELGPLREQLIRRLPPPAAGAHRIWFPQHQTALTLVLGNAPEGLRALPLVADAWYLDGFSPRHNPAAWSAELAALVREKSHGETTITSYCVAGAVRETLASAGMEPVKVPGWKGKKEVLAGRANGTANPSAQMMPARAAIIGAGVAGCSAAAALARRRVEVHLLDRHPAPAAAASGNARGILLPNIARDGNLRTRLFLRGLGSTLAEIATMQEAGHDPVWQGTGVLQLAHKDHLRRLANELPGVGFDPAFLRTVTAEEADYLAGVRVPSGGIFFGSSGSFAPPRFCQGLLESSPMIRFHGGTTAHLLERSAGAWIVRSGDGSILAEAEVVILAGAQETTRFAQSGWLPLRPVKGQVVRLGPHNILDRLQVALCGDGYIARSPGGPIVAGSSFEPWRHDPEIDPIVTEEILNRVCRLVPDFAPASARIEGARAAFRATSPDHVPMAGMLAEPERALRTLSAKGFTKQHFTFAEDFWQAGLYATTAHGSHGFMTAPLVAEMLAEQICADPARAYGEFLQPLNPIRFPLRGRGK